MAQCTIVFFVKVSILLPKNNLQALDVHVLSFEWVLKGILMAINSFHASNSFGMAAGRVSDL